MRDTGVTDVPTADNDMSTDVPVLPDVPVRDATLPPAEIWAHSGRELFLFDPVERRTTSRGLLDTTEIDLEPGPDGIFFSMTDLAVRSDGAVFGLGRDRVWRIDTETAMATTAVTGVQGVAMSFVPPGELTDREELVVGYEGDDGRARLARVDLETRTVEDLATFDGDCETSGDIASIEGLGTFITLRCDFDESQDYLARIDVSSASITRVGPIGVRDIWGLGFWAGVFYGFTSDGQLVSIDATTGRGTVLEASVGADAFWGAGVTPEAPLI